MVHRITGRHLFVHTTGVAVWVPLDANIDDICSAIIRIAEHVECVVNPMIHPHQDGYAISIELPVDILYTGCSLLELAVDTPNLSVAEYDLRMIALLEEWTQEQNHPWRTLRQWAIDNGVPIVDDEDGLTLGMGRFSQTWPLRELPNIEDLQPENYKRIPCVYITGTNGKTTTTRMLSSIVQAQGALSGQYTCVGMTSTDGVVIDGIMVNQGDWTGPGAARQVLRHPTVDFAILETARGGLMRRGLVIENIDAAVVTNVSDDHLGTWGLYTIKDMARAKLTVAFGVQPTGTLILNADYPDLLNTWQEMQTQYTHLPQKTMLFSIEKQEGVDIFLRDGWIVHKTQGQIVSVDGIPLTFHGLATHNIENAMAAIGLAMVVGISIPAIQQGLQRVIPNATTSKGRSNWLQYRGGDIIVDFAHNPDGVRKLAKMCAQWKAQRKIVVLGQAGDRDDQQLRDMAIASLVMQPDLVLLKELPKHAYDKDPHEIVAILRSALEEQGLSASQILEFASEQDVAGWVIDNTMAQDICLFLSHEELDDVLTMLQDAGASWAEIAVQV